jgi:hypothetical protein
MRLFFLTICILLFNIASFSQNDSIVFNNGNYIVGEIKSMDKSIVLVKTKYSDSDFKIKWSRVKKVYTETIFLVSHSDGSKYHGKLWSISNDSVRISHHQYQDIDCKIGDIVYLTEVNKRFIDRLDASIDLGFSLTKSSELRQISSRSTLGYTAENWHTKIIFNTLMSSQQETEDIKRTEGSINERYVFSGNWYSIFTVSLLSNTEQKLDLRMNAQVGMGHFLVRNNSAYWGVKLGFNLNMERYSNETDDRES